MKSMQVTVDIVIFTIQEGVLKVLLIKRRIPPFVGQAAIPGGFVLEDEDLALVHRVVGLRELLEEDGADRAGDGRLCRGGQRRGGEQGGDQRRFRESVGNHHWGLKHRRRRR